MTTNRYYIDNAPAESLPKIDDIRAILDTNTHRAVFVSMQPHGYWSQVVSCRLQRDWQTGKLETAISHSSGGRDPKEVSDDIDAETNFATAILEMTTWAWAARALLNREGA